MVVAAVVVRYYRGEAAQVDEISPPFLRPAFILILRAFAPLASVVPGLPKPAIAVKAPLGG